jgi:hypothetical protein
MSSDSWHLTFLYLVVHIFPSGLIHLTMCVGLPNLLCGIGADSVLYKLHQLGRGAGHHLRLHLSDRDQATFSPVTSPHFAGTTEDAQDALSPANQQAE